MKLQKSGQSALFIVWVAVLLVLAVFTANCGISISNNLLETLPDSKTQQINNLIEKRHLAYSRQIILSVYGDENNFEAAQRLRKALLNHPSLEVSNNDANKVQSILFTYRHQLAPSSFINFLDENNGQPDKILNELKNRSTRLLYQAGQIIPTVPVESDPFGLLSDYLRKLGAHTSIIDSEDNFLFTLPDDEGKSAVLFFLEIDKHSSHIAAQQEIDTFIREQITLQDKEIPELAIFKAGLVFHTATASKEMQGEIKLISAVSTLCILGLFLYSFRSFTPLLCTLGSLFFGVLSGALVTHTLFDNLHILTLVFGATLLGIAVDYSFHFFSHLNFSLTSTGKQAISQIQRKLFISLVSSVTGYLALSMGGLIVLKQMAVFSAFGLIGAWLLVINLGRQLPNLYTQKQPAPIIHLSLIPARLGEKVLAPFNNITGASFKRILPIYLPLFCLLGVIVLLWEIESSPSLLHTPNQQLVEEQGVITEQLGSSEQSRFFIVHGETTEEVLLNEEMLGAELDLLVADGSLTGYSMTSDITPSTNRQQKSHQKLSEIFSIYKTELINHLTGLGYSKMDSQQYFSNFEKNDSPLSLNSEPELTDLLRNLSINKDLSYTSTVELTGIKNSERLMQVAAQYPDIYFFNQVDDIEKALNRESDNAAKYLIVAFLGICLILNFFYNASTSLSIIGIPVLSIASALTILLLLNIDINLFHIFGSFMIMGLGLDYALFAESRVNSLSNLAVTLSALTTCLSFGLLTFSTSPMLYSFGMIALLGTLFNWIYSGLFSRISAS